MHRENPSFLGVIVNQRGYSLVEIMVAAAVLSLTVTSLLKSFHTQLRAAVGGRMSLRAEALAWDKLDTIKTTARNYSMSGGFDRLTMSAAVSDFSLTHSTSVDGVNYTWAVSHSWSSVTGTPDPQDVTWTSSIMRFSANVQWVDNLVPRNVTVTTYVSDITQ
jgi:prepilin-type N-terminal cleavage/methylation domain-containing protein